MFKLDLEKAVKWTCGDFIFQFSRIVVRLPGGANNHMETKISKPTELNVTRMGYKNSFGGLGGIIERVATPTFSH